MRLLKFKYQKKINWGVLEGQEILVLKDIPYKKIILSKAKIALNKVKILPPADPSKIILAGLNYRDHAKELGMKIPKEPVIFLKPPTTLIGQNDKIIYPKSVKRLDYEAELAVVIGKKVKNLTLSKVGNAILGYTCLNDVTARDLQFKDGQWTRAKSFDTFCPLGPWLETDLNSKKLRVKALCNGKEKQNSLTSNFIFPLFYLVSFISKIMTLYPGDVVSTGTPSGVGPMKVGDKIEIEIENLGILTNRVVRER